MTDENKQQILQSVTRPEYFLELKQSAKGDVYGSFSVTGETKEEIERKVEEMVSILNKHTSFK